MPKLRFFDDLITRFFHLLQDQKANVAVIFALVMIPTMSIAVAASYWGAFAGASGAVPANVWEPAATRASVDALRKSFVNFIVLSCCEVFDSGVIRAALSGPGFFLPAD